MPGRLEFDFSVSRSPAPRIRNRGPLRLLIMGDFSALPAALRPALAGRPAHRVDLDNLDAVLHRLTPRLALPGAELQFESMDDFHPDRLLARLPALQALMAMRQRLLDPAHFDAAAAELLQGQPGLVSPDTPPAAAAPAAPGGDLLAQLLGGQPKAVGAGAPAMSPMSGPTAAAAPTGLDALIRQLVAPHIVPDRAPQQAPYLAAIDAGLAEALRGVLHAPGFQALESVWRGLQWLIGNLDLDDDLQLHVLDVSRDELLADVVAAQGHIAQTGLAQALTLRGHHEAGGAGAAGWAALVGLYRFGGSDTDVGLLAAMGTLAAQLGAPWLAGGDTALATAQPGALAAWIALRHSEVAPWIGLAAPRLLLRLPFGPRSDPIEAFKFEELGPAPAHEQYLWGNAALACALLIGRAFSANGWEFEPGDEREIRDLPAHTVLRGGEPELQAGAEFHLSEAAGQALLAAGLMPLMSHRHANAVSLMRFQAVAEPAVRLAGLAWRAD